MSRYINLEYMDIMCDNDRDMKSVMLGMLLEELPNEIAQLQAAHQQKDFNTLGNVSHKLKSTLSFVGYEPMTEANKEIERLAKSRNDSPELAALVSNVQQHLGKVMPELKSVLDIL